MQRNFAFNRETAEACQELIKEGVEIQRTPDDILKNFLDTWEKIQAEYAAKDPFYRKVIESQKKYAEQIVPFRLSWFPPYEFAGNYYWKDKVYRGQGQAGALRQQRSRFFAWKRALRRPFLFPASRQVLLHPRMQQVRRGAAASVFAIVVSRACSRRAASGASRPVDRRGRGDRRLLPSDPCSPARSSTSPPKEAAGPGRDSSSPAA